MKNHNINRKAAKVSTLSSGKIDKYKCFTGEEILPSGLIYIIEKVSLSILR